MNFEYLKDDVLTLLIHLGYLAYDDKTKTVKIPNSEIRAEKTGKRNQGGIIIWADLLIQIIVRFKQH